MLNVNQFHSLLKAVEKFQVNPLISIEIKKEIKEFENTGLQTDLTDVFSTNNGELFKILKDGSIRKIIVHISDVSNYHKSEWDLPRFHIFQCKTLNDMKNKKRSYRYKVSGREDGTFYLVKGSKSFHSPLKFCENCLNIYNKKNKTKKTFNLKSYILKPFMKSDITITDELDICTIPGEYSENWRKISRKLKEDANYICSKCGLDFSGYKKFLHVHHKDANKINNTRENLKVLCIECHSKEPYHGHLKQNPMYKEYLKIKENIF